MGRQRPPGLRRPPGRVEPRRPDLRRGAGPSGAPRDAPGLGRRQAQLHEPGPRAAHARRDARAPRRPRAGASPATPRSGSWPGPTASPSTRSRSSGCSWPRARSRRPAASTGRSATWRTSPCRTPCTRSSRRASTRLDPADRAMLQAAAVLGHSFTVDGLAAVAVARRRRTWSDGSSRSPAASSSIRDLDPRSTERGQFAFVQSLVREVAYSTLARRDRKARHLAAARHFETLVDQELAGALAMHYLAAYRNVDRGSRGRRAGRAGPDRAPGRRRPGGGARRPGAGARLLPRRARGDERAARTRGPARAGRPGRVRRGRSTRRPSGCWARRSTCCARPATAAARRASPGCWATRCSGATGSTPRSRSSSRRAAEFADLGDDPGLATLLGQLARFQMLRQVDFAAAIANADRALAIAERLDRVDLVADAIVTRGVALVSVGRAYEGIGCLETGPAPRPAARAARQRRSGPGRTWAAR